MEGIEEDFAAAEAMLEKATELTDLTDAPVEEEKEKEPIKIENEKYILLEGISSEDIIRVARKLSPYTSISHSAFQRAVISGDYICKKVESIIRYEIDFFRFKVLFTVPETSITDLWVIDIPVNSFEEVKYNENGAALYDEFLNAYNKCKKKFIDEKNEKEEEKKKKKENKLEERKNIIKTLAEEIHPGDWDFSKLEAEHKPVSNSEYKLVIHFPDIEITNKRRDPNPHRIRDLYIGMFFDKEMNHIGGLYGARGRVTYAEYSSRYLHSHLSFCNYFSRWHTFCLGGGGSTIYMLVNGLTADRWNPDSFQSLLLTLHTFARWESIEGGPYIQKKHIRSGSSRPITITNDILESHFDSFVATYKDFPCSLEKRAGGFSKLIVDSKDPDLIAMVTSIASVYQLRTEKGEYINMDNGNIDSYEVEEFNNLYKGLSGNNTFKFKGEYVHTICKEHEDDIKEEKITKVAHSSITRHIAKELTDYINEYQLKTQQYELKGV